MAKKLFGSKKEKEPEVVLKADYIVDEAAKDKIIEFNNSIIDMIRKNLDKNVFKDIIKFISGYKISIRFSIKDSRVNMQYTIKNNSIPFEYNIDQTYTKIEDIVSGFDKLKEKL